MTKTKRRTKALKQAWKKVGPINHHAIVQLSACDLGNSSLGWRARGRNYAHNARYLRRNQNGF